ncbi:glucosamine-6-phosphate deaminase [Gaoshiqia sediminis]|uniref:Glucosamine-6-phosphate deaminase n=1 Tax=Gaoshiqia sediminis TaxID=2986998 RepID=A0AA42C8Y1_9BACT|nr:glucosamine-6-phosphate deaminase [Gaoshiqia sediminis]MCW0481415.1 glucosamine-6-phosphate deaminase [Gaoshiqia sediminis]
MVKTLNYIEKTIEKLPVYVLENKQEGARIIAGIIAGVIKEKQARGEMAVLGLATGSSPVKVYRELVRLHHEEELSFKNVITFNLDEYFPMSPDSHKSYVHFMYKHLFNHIDIDPANVHIPDGTLKIDQVAEFCNAYEDKIRACGGIDIQLLGIGRSGHIGFNEPGATVNSQTRLVKLDPITIADAIKDFGSEEAVPHRAITMGIDTILSARKIVLAGWGKSKSPILKKMIEGPVTPEVPASFLQMHEDVTVYLDEAATSEFTRTKAPWLVGVCDWTPKMVKRAVIWLSQKLDKPILKLTDEDYKHAGLRDLLASYGGAYDLNIKVFGQIRDTITGWPGGKPGATEKTRPERPEPAVKRSLIFSPHPDDDVISMGGTLIRLADQGHDVHVAYQTSGNIAVFDDDAIRFSQFAVDLLRSQKIDCQELGNANAELKDFLTNKKPGQVDTPYVKTVKGLIRAGEAAAGCRFSGVKEENVHFLNLPFYETGQVEKSPASDADVQIIIDLLRKIQPHQIFAAGDLQDPHGTHEVCLQIIFKAIRFIRAAGDAWLNDCYVWLYRGAWQEWDVEDIEMAVPISPSELMRKRKAIFKHQSQKDEPVFPGEDKREFWQRAEARNRETAKIYDQLGLTEYEAIEAFVRYPFDDEDSFLK